MQSFTYTWLPWSASEGGWEVGRRNVRQAARQQGVAAGSSKISAGDIWIRRRHPGDSVGDCGACSSAQTLRRAPCVWQRSLVAVVGASHPPAAAPSCCTRRRSSRAPPIEEGSRGGDDVARRESFRLPCFLLSAAAVLRDIGLLDSASTTSHLPGRSRCTQRTQCLSLSTVQGAPSPDIKTSTFKSSARAASPTLIGIQRVSVKPQS